MIDGRDGEVMFAKRAGRAAADRQHHQADDRAADARAHAAEPGVHGSDYRPAPVESQIGLRPGERMRVRDLFEALMLESANDAAETLAEGIAGSRARFVRGDERARAQLGLDDTSYANPIGLDDPPTTRPPATSPRLPST